LTVITEVAEVRLGMAATELDGAEAMVVAKAKIGQPS
jgi:hypothetical protein